MKEVNKVEVCYTWRHRLIAFLQVAGNNKSETVLNAFFYATCEFGLPSRKGIDQGGENVGVSQYMLAHPQHGPNQASVIAGQSVHNQRIERSWRDLCTNIFLSAFLFI